MSFSLPTQRCFHRIPVEMNAPRLFSAYAEVFLRDWFWKLKDRYFSLPTQRCFRLGEHRHRLDGLFSAYAEVFPTGLPADRKPSPFLCLRRGVSPGKVFLRDLRHFSLPTQRCFLPWTLNRWSRRLFSAYAEVFPAPTTLMSAWPPFLCLRRGVSHPLGHGSGVSFFSLPTQRCF